MRNERIAVLDVRSYEVSFLIGSKDINNAVPIKDKCVQYEGFAGDGFFDEESFCRAVTDVVTSVRKTHEGKIDQVYVGVPAFFIRLVTKWHGITFRKKRKITASDVDTLFESGLSDLAANGKCIRRSAMYFSLGDATKYYRAEEMYSTPAASLSGGLSYYFIDETFDRLVCGTLQKLGISKVEYWPQSLAQAQYLLPAKEREGYAFLLDVGFLNSSISVVYGDGIVHEAAFSCGVASILVSLMESLGVDYETAEEILRSANISGGGVAPDLMWTDENGAAFPVAIINDVIKYGVDMLCEKVQEFFVKHYREKENLIMNKTLWITGEGVEGIAGIAEHISRRLNHMHKIARPDLPYHDRAGDSSKVALLAMAAATPKKKGWSLFGGRK